MSEGGFSINLGTEKARPLADLDCGMDLDQELPI